MARCTFENLTVEQAKTLAEWFEGQGEQDADMWFDINCVPTPWSDGIEYDEAGNVTVYCK